MSESTSREPLFAGQDDAGEIREYRSLSGWAVASLALGLLSPLALIDPLLILFPLISSACAAWALVDIARRDDRWGKPLAVITLVLAVFFSTWSLGRALSEQWWLHGEGRKFGAGGLELVVTGERYRAHELHLSPISRQGAEVSLEAFYENSPGARRQLEEFFERAPLPAITALGPDTKIEFVREEEAAPGPDAGTHHVVQRYRVSNGERSLLVRLVMARVVGSDGVARWKVIDLVELAE